MEARPVQIAANASGPSSVSAREIIMGAVAGMMTVANFVEKQECQVQTVHANCFAVNQIEPPPTITPNSSAEIAQEVCFQLLAYEWLA